MTAFPTGVGRQVPELGPEEVRLLLTYALGVESSTVRTRISTLSEAIWTRSVFPRVIRVNNSAPGYCSSAATGEVRLGRIWKNRQGELRKKRQFAPKFAPRRSKELFFTAGANPALFPRLHVIAGLSVDG